MSPKRIIRPKDVLTKLMLNPNNETILIYWTEADESNTINESNYLNVYPHASRLAY